MRAAGIEQIASLKINELLIFVELSQVKSVREIARRRKVDPATISRTLLRIEKALGRTLFVRTADGITPNDSCREVILKCRQLLGFLDGVSSGSESQEILSFGSNSFLSTHLLGGSIHELVHIAQGQVRLLDFAPDELIAAGLKGAFNVAIHFDRLPWPESTWTSVPLGEMQWGLYCRKAHPLANKNNLKVAEILKHAFVFPIYWGATEVSMGNDQLPIPLFRRKKGVGTSTAETAYAAMQNADLLAYLPSLITTEKVISGKIIELETPWTDVKKVLYLTVKSDTLTASKFRDISKNLKSRIAGLV